MLNSARSARALIVEDETFIALMLQQELENLEFSVQDIATTQAGARQCLAQSTPDLVLLDYNLGIETSHQIAYQLNELGVPYILCTAAERAAACDPHITPIGVLSKPIDFGRLHALIAQAVLPRLETAAAQAA